ncbi:MAG: hypothetical protein CFE34_13455 [Rhodobacteraceae bacterium PARR1]|nr:MAG: hypothetical protein CFE34_13455 [Rhodobacteraceae bacterium PARR1]
MTALIGVAGTAQAQSTGLTRSAIETAYAEFERIEIAFGPTQVKVEAVDAQTGQVVEAIYDRATGAILKEETSSIAGSVGTGIEVKSRTEDFVRVRASDNADDGLDRAFDDNPKGDDDDGIDDTTGGDDSDDDSAGSRSNAAAAHDANDDKGRGRGRSGSGGSDDDGSDDDRGGDRSGKGGSGNGGSGKGGSGNGGSDDDGDDD